MLPCGGRIIMSQDIPMFYKQRIAQIEKEENQAILNKKWSELAKLRAEKSNLEGKIEEMKAENDKK
jgi:hypothetical protein